MATKPIDWAATPADVANLPRNAVHDMIELLIERLDREDGDPDLEDDDPAGDPLDDGEAPDMAEVMKTLPIYAIDQTKGPINEPEAYRVHMLSMTS